MQKKIIALAIAGLASTAAFAQTNVTIYGVADATLEVAKSTGANGGDVNNVAGQSRLASNSSLLGFKGVEDLGNGLKALFQFESGIDFTGNGDASWNTTRDSFVGLTGGFGTAVAGTLTHPIRAMGAKVDFNPGASSVGFTGGMYGEIMGIKTGTDDRAKNAVAYVSPSFSGFTVTGAYVSSGAVATNDAKLAAQNSSQNTTGGTHSQQYQLAAQYENGPAYFGVAYHRANDPRVLGNVVTALNAAVAAGLPAANANYQDKLSVVRLAGKYALPTGTTISALYDRQKYTFDSAQAAIGSAAVKRAAWMVGVNQNFMGKNNVYLQYARANATKADGDKLDNTGANQWTLGYTYDLSKRTMVHAYYTALKNQDAAQYDNYVNGLTPNVGGDNKIFGAGLRHSF